MASIFEAVAGKAIGYPKALAALSSRKPAKQLGLPSTSLLVRSLLMTLSLPALLK
jgi:hypothetical protein